MINTPQIEKVAKTYTIKPGDSAYIQSVKDILDSAQLMFKQNKLWDWGARIALATPDEHATQNAKHIIIDLCLKSSHPDDVKRYEELIALCGVVKETPEQKKIRELKATIEKANKEVQELERSVK